MDGNDDNSNTTGPSPRVFQVLLVSDRGCGKTTWLRRLQGHPFEKVHGTWTNLVPTQNIKLPTCPDMVFKVSQMSSLHEMNYHDCVQNFQGAIVMFDVTSRFTYKSTPSWHHAIQQKFGDIPVILCGNKVEFKDRKVKPRQITLQKKKRNIVQYYDISVKTGYSVSKPFVKLARTISGDNSLGRLEQFDCLKDFLPALIGPGRLPTSPEVDLIRHLSENPKHDAMIFYFQLKKFGFEMLPQILPRVLAPGYQPTDSELRLLSLICSDSATIVELFVEMFSLLIKCQFLD